MPPIGCIIGGVNFSDLKYDLPAQEVAGAKLAPASIGYGASIQAAFDFVLIAAFMFALFKVINAMGKKPESPAAPPEPTPEIKLLSEIRDILKEG